MKDSFDRPLDDPEKLLVRRIEVKGHGSPWDGNLTVALSNRQFIDAFAGKSRRDRNRRGLRLLALRGRTTRERTARAADQKSFATSCEIRIQRRHVAQPGTRTERRDE
jgi:hypothetical protein